METIGNILKRQMKNTPLAREVNTSRVIDECNEWIAEKFGNENLKYARGVYLKSKILHIACLSSVFGQELKFVEREMVTHLQKKFSRNVVAGVRYLL